MRGKDAVDSMTLYRLAPRRLRATYYRSSGRVPAESFAAQPHRDVAQVADPSGEDAPENIYMYDKNTGELLGQLLPGPEVGSDMG